MTGFNLAVLMALCVIGTMAFLWLAPVLDTWRANNREATYRHRWNAAWSAYKREHPGANQQTYKDDEYREFRERWPINLPYKKLFSFEKLFLFGAVVCLLATVVLFAHAYMVWGRDTHRAAFTNLCWATGIAVVVLLAWYWMLLEEVIVPHFARKDPAYTPVPPIQW